MPTGRKPRECALQRMPLRTESSKQLASAVMDALRDEMPHVDYATIELRIAAALETERASKK